MIKLGKDFIGHHSKAVPFRGAIENGSWSKGAEFVLGLPNVKPELVDTYLQQYGRTFTPQPLPPGIQRGEPGLCFHNATLLLIERPMLTYAEGYARRWSGMVFLHGWTVTRTGHVIDPTWEHPERCEYFGVQYDRAAYLRRVVRQKFYGILGGNHATVEWALRTGAHGVREGSRQQLKVKRIRRKRYA